jgi:RNA polymerase sigma-70 factor (ECF subfamily)
MMARSAMRESATSAAPAVTGVDRERAAAFQRLADQHLDASYRLAHSILSNPNEAQDAVHDAFVTAWQKWTTLRDHDRFDAWFRRILVNTCRDRLRRRSRTDTDISHQTRLTAPDHASSITERVRVEQALSRLKPDDRILIALRHHHDLTVSDIAYVIGVPSGTVKWRLHRAHKRLGALLDDGEGSGR